MKARLEATKKFGKKVREFTGRKDVDVVFEHVGQQTFPTSVFLAKKFGKIVICRATTGFKQVGSSSCGSSSDRSRSILCLLRSGV